MKWRARPRTIAAALAVLGCGEGPGGDAASPGADTVARRGALPDWATAVPAPPSLPPDPDPDAGRLRIRGSGDVPLEGVWPARAGMCDTPGLLQVVSGDPAVGVLVLVLFPRDGAAPGRYPVRVTREGLPAPPAAQVAVQVFEDPEAYALHALTGEVELTELAARASGRFRAALVEVVTQQRIGVAGVFSEVPVRQLPEWECERAASAVDTTVADTAATAGADTARGGV